MVDWPPTASSPFSLSVRMAKTGRVSVVRDEVEVAVSEPLRAGRWYRVEYGDWAGLTVRPRPGEGRTPHAEVTPRGVHAARDRRVSRQLQHARRRAGRSRPRPVPPVALAVQIRSNSPAVRFGAPPRPGPFAVGGPVPGGSFHFDRIPCNLGRITEYAIAPPASLRLACDG